MRKRRVRKEGLKKWSVEVRLLEPEQVERGKGRKDEGEADWRMWKGH